MSDEIESYKGECIMNKKRLISVVAGILVAALLLSLIISALPV